MFLPLLIFLAWGSYLNSLAYRLLNLQDFFRHRSFCPSCKATIAWYDNIPVLSWIALQAQCRTCDQKISWLYPFIEIITTCLLFLLWHAIPSKYFIIYFIFFSALIITIRTDIDRMLISRFVTIYLVPIGLVAAYSNELPITPIQSMLGTIFGYSILWITKKISFLIAKQDSLGQGDVELLAFIGAFTGPLGCWVALLVGSMSGSFLTLIYIVLTKQRIQQIPFGAYLSFGAMIYVLLQNLFIQYFLV